jgi:hypothetical protein
MNRMPWLGLVSLTLACSSSTPTVTPVPPVVLVHPPADPGGPPPVPTSGASDVSVFAIRTLSLGDADRTGVASSQAWGSFGFDLDGADTTEYSAGVCQLAAGAAGNAQQDGRGGVDNSFGENLMPLIVTAFGSEFATAMNESLTSGLVTDLIVVHGLGAATTASPLSAELVVAAPLGAIPAWSTADVWPVDSSSLLDGDPGAPLLAFPQSYEVGGVFVAEPPSGDGEIALGTFMGVPLVVPIRHVQITMTLSADGMTATSGTISGIMPTDRFTDVARRFAQSLIPEACPASAWNSIGQQIGQAQDIRIDGTEDPSQPCSGISLGIGFEAVRVQRGPVAVVAPLGNGCADVGAGP